MLSDGLPFAGLTLENKDGSGPIELAIGNGTYDHQFHNIYEPVKIAFEPSGSKAGTLDILDASGTTTLITFVQPMPALMEYAAGDLLPVQ